MQTTWEGRYWEKLNLTHIIMYFTYYPLICAWNYNRTPNLHILLQINMFEKVSLCFLACPLVHSVLSQCTPHFRVHWDNFWKKKNEYYIFLFWVFVKIGLRQVWETCYLFICKKYTILSVTVWIQDPKIKKLSQLPPLSPTL